MNLSMGRLKQVLFAHGDMQGSALESCRLEAVAFDTCSLVEAEFSRTSLKGMDLTSSRLEGLRLGVGDLRGVIVSPRAGVGFNPLFRTGCQGCVSDVSKVQGLLNVTGG